MIVDSSAVLAILLKEPDHERLRAQLTAAEYAGIGAPTVVETALVLASRLGRAGTSLLARFLQEAELDVIDFRAEHWSVATNAFLRYGKGRHRAALNYGDCMTYAVTKLAGEPLLCKGNDFPETDLVLATSEPAT